MRTLLGDSSMVMRVTDELDGGRRTDSAATLHAFVMTRSKIPGSTPPLPGPSCDLLINS